jgi:hypothetical protein
VREHIIQKRLLCILITANPTIIIKVESYEVSVHFDALPELSVTVS